MGESIKATLLFAALFVISIILSVYTFYFFGMAVSVTTGALLGLSGTAIATTFAWVGVAFAVIITIAVLIVATIESRRGSSLEISEEEFEKIFEDILKDEGDDN